MYPCVKCNQSTMATNLSLNVPERDYKSGVFIIHKRVCGRCVLGIRSRNNVYDLLSAHFDDNLGRLMYYREEYTINTQLAEAQ